MTDQVIETLREETENGEIEWEEPDSTLPTPIFQAVVEEKTVTVARDLMKIEDWSYQSEKVTELYELVKEENRPHFVEEFFNDVLS